VKFSSLILLVLIIGSVAAVVYFGPLSIVNMPEGFDVRFYGFNPWPEQCWSAQCVYSLDKSVDPPYYYSSRGLYNAVFGKQNQAGVTCDPITTPWGQVVDNICLATDSYEFKVNLQTPEKVGSELAVKYYIQYPNGTVIKYVAYREVYEFNVEIVSVPKKASFGEYGELWYAGVAEDLQLWFAMGTVVWNKAFPDPDNASLHAVNAYNVPIAVYVVSSALNSGETEVRAEGGQNVPASIPSEIYNYVITDADAGGRRITMYDEPTTRADPVEYFSDPSDPYVINQTLASDPRPDDRFRSVVYFPITLVHFGNYYEFRKDWGVHEAYVWYPAKTIRLRVIYLRFGKFVYTLQSDTSVIPTWTTETPHSVTTTHQAGPTVPAPEWPDIGGWLQSPAGFITLLIILAALFIVLGLVLMFVGGGRVVVRR